MAAAVLVGLVALVAVGAVGIAGARGEVYTPRGPGVLSAAVGKVAAPTHDPGKPTAVFLLGPEGANAADVLAPYEVLAASGAFNLYTVAPARQPVPLTGNLDLMPDLSLGELEQRLPGGPEVIVVPQLTEVAAGVPPSLGPVIAWLQRQRAQGDPPLLVSVCVGAQVLAEAGLLDGRPATAHWLGLVGLRRTYPQVDWTDGVSYVDDGDLISTAGVLYGVNGALRVIERLVGPAAAAKAARAVAWPAYTPGRPHPIPRFGPAPPDVVGLLSAGYRWDRPTTGVLLTDGVTETELASAFRPYTELSYLARTVAVTTDGRPVRSRHGLTFLPRADLADAAAAGLDRLLVPGADAARRAAADGIALPEGLTPIYLHTQPGFAFDGPVRDIAGTRDVATARWVAKTLQYPTDLQLAGPAWPWTLTLRPILIATLAAIAAAMGIQLLRRRRRGAFRGGDRAAPPAQPTDTSSNAEPSLHLTRGTS